VIDIRLPDMRGVRWMATEPKTRMRRREFLFVLGGAVAARPLTTRAQQAMPVIGYLQAASPDGDTLLLAAFRKGLSEMGYVEGRNLAIEYRYGQGQLDRLPDLAADLVRRQVAVIVTLGSDASALAAKSASTTIPIVFEIGGDPVQSGFVASLNRPGGNATGFTAMNAELTAKRLGLLHELLPQAQRFATLVNRSSPATELIVKVLQAAASRIGVHVEFFDASNNAEIDTAFANIVQNRFAGFVSGLGPPFNERFAQIVSLAARHALPGIYAGRDYAAIGGLMSYSTTIDRFRQAGLYAGRILKGEKPDDLPVLQPTKFEFVINLQTAKLIGINVPPTLLATADEVIE
jgi:putative ABC transport system substrate-binding protein